MDEVFKVGGVSNLHQEAQRNCKPILGAGAVSHEKIPSLHVDPVSKITAPVSIQLPPQNCALLFISALGTSQDLKSVLSSFFIQSDGSVNLNRSRKDVNTLLLTHNIPTETYNNIKEKLLDKDNYLTVQHKLVVEDILDRFKDRGAVFNYETNTVDIKGKPRIFIDRTEGLTSRELEDELDKIIAGKTTTRVILAGAKGGPVKEMTQEAREEMIRVDAEVRELQAAAERSSTQAEKTQRRDESASGRETSSSTTSQSAKAQREDLKRAQERQKAMKDCQVVNLADIEKKEDAKKDWERQKEKFLGQVENALDAGYNVALR